MEVKDYISLGSMLIALVAVVIGPLITLKISKKQILSPMRHTWISTLRGNIAEFISLISINRLAYCPSMNWDEDRKERIDKVDLEKYERLMLLEAKINLHLHPLEESHKKLSIALKSTIKKYHDSYVSEDEKNELMEVARKILKKEWEITKNT